jgi:hypothetical protein
MSAFAFDFDLEDDLDESFDVIPPHEPAAVPSIDRTLVSEGEPAEEIALSALVRVNVFSSHLLQNHIWFGSAALHSARSVLVKVLVFTYNAPSTY